jgi:O-antigen ligase
MKFEKALKLKHYIALHICLAVSIAMLILKSDLYIWGFVATIAVGITVLFIIKYPELITYLFVISLFFGFLFYRNAEIGFTISDFLFVIITFSFISGLFFYKNKKEKLIGDKQNQIIIAYSVFIFFSIFSLFANLQKLPNNYLFLGIIKVFFLVQYLIVFLIFSMAKFKSNYVINLIYLFSVLQFPIVIYQYFGGLSANSDINRDVCGIMSYHHGMIGTFMLMPLGLIIGHIKCELSPIKRCVMVILAGIFLTQIILSGNRSSLLGLGISTVFFLILNFKFKKKYLIIVVLVLFFSYILYQLTPLKSLISATFQSGTSTTIDTSSLGRLIIWKGALDFFANSEMIVKFFGVGMGAFALIPLNVVIFNGMKIAFGAHNNFINVLCETGIFGFLAFSAFFAITLWRLYKIDHPIAKSFFYTTIALLFSGLTQESFWVTSALHNLWVFYMIFLAIIMKFCTNGSLKNEKM